MYSVIQCVGVLTHYMNINIKRVLKAMLSLGLTEEVFNPRFTFGSWSGGGGASAC